MSWWQPDRFERRKPHLEARMAMIRSIRAYFDGQGFAEVQTPALQVMPTADTHIHAFKTEMQGPDLRPERTLYLHTSPELAMKKLLVAGMAKIYQIGPVFRNGENSRLHSPEFTMLEWYRSGAGWRDIVNDCVDILCNALENIKTDIYTYRGQTADPCLKWNIVSVAEAFDLYSDIDLENCLENPEKFRGAVDGQGIRTADGDGWEDLFFRVMAEKIEPNLGVGVPAILYDYPACLAALARKKPGDPRFAERFELYVCGVELANGFGELTDAAEQRQRFEADMTLKEELYGERYPLDEDFLRALDYGMPESAGMALGIDRLVMLATGAEDIEKVLWCGRF